MLIMRLFWRVRVYFNLILTLGKKGELAKKKKEEERIAGCL